MNTFAAAWALVLDVPAPPCLVPRLYSRSRPSPSPSIRCPGPEPDWSSTLAVIPPRHVVPLVLALATHPYVFDALVKALDLLSPPLQVKIPAGTARSHVPSSATCTSCSVTRLHLSVFTSQGAEGLRAASYGDTRANDIGEWPRWGGRTCEVGDDD